MPSFFFFFEIVFIVNIAYIMIILCLMYLHDCVLYIYIKSIFCINWNLFIHFYFFFHLGAIVLPSRRNLNAF